MSESASERRKSRRLSITADVIVSMMIPEETFTPNSVRGYGLEISQLGMSVKTYQLSQEEYTALMKGVRYARILLFLPYYEDPLDFKAALMWSDYHAYPGNDKPHCLLGFRFNNMAPGDVAKLEDAYNRLSRDSVSDVPRNAVRLED